MSQLTEFDSISCQLCDACQSTSPGKLHNRAGCCACSSGSELLLLLRNSKHNNNTWGLPGGNVEDEDTDLLVTAKREAQEEMGSVPEATYQNQILTK